MKRYNSLKFLVFTVCLGMIGLMWSCSGDNPTDQPETDGTLKVVVTTNLLEDMAINVSPDGADITAIMGAGIDPHVYNPKPADLQLLKEADIVFYHGLLFEGKMLEYLEQLGQQTTVVDLGATLNSDLLIGSEDYDDAYDPHVWFDISLWKDMATNMSSALKEANPDASDEYDQALETYLQSLDQLDGELNGQFDGIAEDARVLITTHDAFSYFGRSYGLEILALQGVSTAGDVGLKDVTDMVNTIIDREIKAVFVEQTVSPKTLQAVIEGCAEKGWEVTNAGSLYADALGPKDSEEGTYIGMMQSNASIIVQGLQ